MVLIYDYYLNNLEKEFKRRKEKGEGFKDGEILYIIDSVINSLIGMRQEHGELDLENILIDEN